MDKLSVTSFTRLDGPGGPSKPTFAVKIRGYFWLVIEKLEEDCDLGYLYRVSINGTDYEARWFKGFDGPGDTVTQFCARFLHYA
jgi:hypothetical protein